MRFAGPGACKVSPHQAVCYSSPVSESLPAFARGDAVSVAYEARDYRDRTPAERAWMVGAACRAAARMIALRDDGDTVLDFRDPVPASSLKALARLRAAARAAE